MPKRTKKLLVYLDQNFISDMAKADIKNTVKREWKDLYLLLKEGFLAEKLVVPQSWFHKVETSLTPVLKNRIVSYQNHLGQVDLHSAEHVRNFQTGRFLQRFLGKSDKDPFEPEIAFRDPPDQRVKQFNITVDFDLSHWGFQSRRATSAAEMETIRIECIAKKVRYEDHLEKELSAQRDYFLNNTMYYAHLCDDPVRDLAAFSKDLIFRTMPVVSIYSRLWSKVLTKHQTRKIEKGDATDIDVLSTYLPYMDVVGTDAFMTTQLTALGIDKEQDVRVFNAKTTSLQAFCDFLRDYLENSPAANRPAISVFVLPSRSIKEHAFRLFFDLGAAARLFGIDEYATVYGFDDGSMPRYKLRQMPGHEVPFYGLQDVNRIMIEPKTTMEEVLDICRENCSSDYFVLLDEYRPIKETFLLGAKMAAEAGLQINEGYRIYSMKT